MMSSSSAARPVGLALSAPCRTEEDREHAAAERIATIFDEHYDAMWRILRRLGVPEASADDAAQRVFLVAARRLSTILAGQEGPYLYGIAIRIASEIRRRDPSRREVAESAAVLEAMADDAPGPEEALLEHEARDALDAVLADLPDDLREVLVLAEIEELPAPEVAAMLEIPIGTVASRLRRAREAFTKSARRIRARLETERATSPGSAREGSGGAR